MGTERSLGIDMKERNVLSIIAGTILTRTRISDLGGRSTTSKVNVGWYTQKIICDGRPLASWQRRGSVQQALADGKFESCLHVIVFAGDCLHSLEISHLKTLSSHVPKRGQLLFQDIPTIISFRVTELLKCLSQSSCCLNQSLPPSYLPHNVSNQHPGRGVSSHLGESRFRFYEGTSRHQS